MDDRHAAYGIPLRSFSEGEGTLVPLEYGDLSFEPQRDFIIADVPNTDVVRGSHAHRACHQLFRCLAGRIVISVRKPGEGFKDFVLRPYKEALWVPPLRWVEITGLQPTDALLVTCSHAYDPDDYIHDPDEFDRL